MPTDSMESLKDLIKQHGAVYCIECGKCSAVCPVTLREMRAFESPRMLVEAMLTGDLENTVPGPLLWSCLTCARCSELCPADVHFIDFIRDARHIADPTGGSGTCTHGEMMDTWARIMTHSDLSQNRLEWLTGDLKTSDASDTLYFTGCLPYYDRVFKDLAFEGVAIARGAVKILNHLGIVPQVMPNERCCGHDRLFQGDHETFGKLARLNLDQFKTAGVRRIVTTCPECARALKIDYPALVVDHGIPVMHITELLHEHLCQTPLPNSVITSNHCVTYHDPCRLGRHMGVYDAPRKVFAHFGTAPLEMAASRQQSLCCGTTCWTTCGQVSKQIQTDRLKQAKATGAELLVTACPKCQIHLKCAQNDPELKDALNIAVQDITTWVGERL